MAYVDAKTKYQVQLAVLVLTGVLLLIGSVPLIGWTLNQSLLGSVTLGTILGFIQLWMAYEKYKRR